MKVLKQLSLITVMAAMVTLWSCGDGPNAKPGPEVSFKTGDTYVSADISYPVNKGFKVGISASSSNMIRDMKISKSVNGGPDEVQSCSMCDTMISAFDFEADFLGTSGSSAGTEKWSFSLTDDKGNVTTKSITLTLLASGDELYSYEMDNGNPPQAHRLWNANGPNNNLSAYQMGAGYLGPNDPSSWKDVVDSIASNDGANWPGRWASRNGSQFKKTTAYSWSAMQTTAQLEAAWEASGSAMDVINPATGDIYILKTPTNYAFIQITDVENTASDELDYIQFRYKFRP